MATYGTDLTTLNDAESTTWLEFTPYALGGSPVADGENFIQGVDCRSQTTGQKSGASFSIVYDNGSALSWTTGEVFLIWQYFAVGADLASYANGGLRVGIGSSLSAISSYDTGGNDRSPYPYGAWQNVAVDPQRTADRTDGGGNGGSYQYVGSILNITLKISKGTPHACDAIRYGRGEIYCTGTSCDFDGFATYNDYNDATNGYNRYGLFQDTGGGTYLWKGLLSIGQTATSATFSDSNKSITIDDAAKTYAAFNKIEIHNASTSVTWTNVSFTSLGTVSPGNFEMVDDATVTLTSCVFGNMGTFIFDSNATVSNTVFNGCGQVTLGAGTFTACTFTDSTNASATLAATPAEAALVSGSTFNSDGTGYGMEIGGTAANITLTDNTWVGYASSDGSTGNEAIYVNIATGSMTITVSGGTTPSIRTAGCTVTVNSDTTVTFTGMKDNSEVRVYKVSDDSVVAGIEDATTGTTDNRSFAWSAPATTEVYYRIHCFEPGDEVYETIYVPSYTVPSNDTSVPISQRLDRNAEN